MKTKKLGHIHKIALAGTISLFTIMLFSSAFAPVDYTWYWSKDVRFGLTGYNTDIGFASNIHLGSFTFVNGTAITFNDVYMGEGNVAELTIGTETANITIDTLSDTQLDYAVTGVGTQEINLGNKRPTRVVLDGSYVMEDLGYSYSNGTVTVDNALSTANLTFRPTETSIFIPTGRGEYTTETWYFRSDTWTVNSELGYKLHTSQSENTTYVESTSASLQDLTIGIKVYRVKTNGDTIPVTDTIVAEATQSGLTAGTMLNTTYTLSGDVTDLTLDDAIQVVLYQQLGTGIQSPKATFITRNLRTDEMNTNTWTLNYYVSVTEDAGTYYYRFHYGDSSTDSKIVNVQYVTLDPWGTSLYYLGKGDLFAFIFNPYSYYIGQEIAFGIIALGFIVPAYNRYRDIRPVAVLCLLFGGTGGLLTAVIPSIAIKLSFLFLAFGVAIILYKLIR